MHSNLKIVTSNQIQPNLILKLKMGGLLHKCLFDPNFGAFEWKSPQGFSNDYSVFPDCILG